MLHEKHRKGIISIRCENRHQFNKLIKWIGTQGDFDHLWDSGDYHAIFHRTIRNTICIDWRYWELDIGSYHSFKHVLDYKNVVQEEESESNSGN